MSQIEIEREDVDRLERLELGEIPRLQAMLSEWPDDPYIAGSLRRLREEAARLRELTGSAG
jgi:hypothetical protein